MFKSRTPPTGAEAHPPDEHRRWRADRLAAAGFPRELAERVAADPGYDVHALIELTERDCPPDLACRILAPLEPPA
jgi:hypothetical protein